MTLRLLGREPERMVAAFREIGRNCRSTLVWQKSDPDDVHADGSDGKKHDSAE